MADDRKRRMPSGMSASIYFEGMSMDVFPYHAAGSGFLLGASLIFSIGPQNLALINAGLARDNMLLVASIGYISEILLVGIGLTGFRASPDADPDITAALHLLGILFLVFYGVCAIRRGLQRPLATDDRMVASCRSRWNAAVSVLAVTWLNPLVYIEIVLLVGLVASAFDSRIRIWFGAGFLLASAVRFYGCSLTGQMLRSWLGHPARQRQFAMISGCLLLGSAAMLAARAAHRLVVV